MNPLIKNILFTLTGVVVGVILATKYCSKPTETITVTQYKIDTLKQLDTLYYPYKVYVDKIIAVTKYKDSIKIEYKDKNVTVIDYYPVLDSSCMVQLDSVRRFIELTKDSTVLKEKVFVNVVETITKTITPAKTKQLYASVGTLYDINTKEYNYAYGVEYQFKNKVAITANAFIPFYNKSFAPQKYSVHLKVPLFKIK
jgi:hypothetical protein